MATQTQMQVGALKELIMAKQAMARALEEFCNTLPYELNDSRVALMLQQLPEDPRETDEDTLKRVLFLSGICPSRG